MSKFGRSRGWRPLLKHLEILKTNSIGWSYAYVNVKKGKKFFFFSRRCYLYPSWILDTLAISANDLSYRQPSFLFPSPHPALTIVYGIAGRSIFLSSTCSRRVRVFKQTGRQVLLFLPLVDVKLVEERWQRRVRKGGFSRMIRFLRKNDRKRGEEKNCLEILRGCGC